MRSLQLHFQDKQTRQKKKKMTERTFKWGNYFMYIVYIADAPLLQVYR